MMKVSLRSLHRIAKSPAALTIRVALLPWVLWGLSSQSHCALSSPLPNDYGPADAVVAIRHDLPLLLAAELDEMHLTPSVDWVVADKRDAIASWHAKHVQGLVALGFRSGKWWWRAAAATTPSAVGYWTRLYAPGNELTDCGVHWPVPPSVQELVSRGFIDSTLATHLTGRLRAKPIDHVITVTEWSCDSFTPRTTQDGYDAVFTPKPDVSDDGVQFQLSGRGPTERQIAERSTGLLYYSFDLAARPFNKHIAPSRLTQRGAVFSLWFPFVLDLNNAYTLSLSNVDTELQTTSASIKHNVLSFSLPQFVIRTGATAHGAILRQPTAASP